MTTKTDPHRLRDEVRLRSWRALPSTRKAAIATGETRFFTGRPCAMGHTAPRHACNSQCIRCHKVYRSRRDSIKKGVIPGERNARQRVDDLQLEREISKQLNDYDFDEEQI